MLTFDQWVLPAGEQHLQGWMLKVNRRVEGRLSYQYHKYEAALKFCRARRVCCDVGAHVGLFSYWMSRDFQSVQAFEPVAAHRECFALNITAPNVTLHACALGEKDGSVSMKTAPTSSGDSFVSGHSMLAAVAGDGNIPMKRLDSFELQDVDFLKLDLEGFELFALRGGEETLKRCRPCVIVEQKKGMAQKFGLPETGAVAYLQSLGAELRVEMSGDFVMSW